MEVFVVRLGQPLAPGARFVQRGRNLGNTIAFRQRSPAAGKQLLILQRFPLLRPVLRFHRFRLHGLASGHYGGLDLAAALHQLLKDPVELVEVSVAGNESSCLKAAAGNQIERLAAKVRSVVEGGAQGDVGVVNAIGVERDVRSQGAPAKKIHRPAFAHHFHRFFPLSPRVSRMALRMLMVCTTWAAPNCRAASTWPSCLTMAMTLQPAKAATCRIINPSGPPPITATVSPGCGCESSKPCTAQASGSVSAACSSGTWSGTCSVFLATIRAGMRINSA